MDPLILASASPRRRQLLEWANIVFEVQAADADETIPPGVPLDTVPIEIARRKAAAILDRCGPDRLILAADTLVMLDDQAMGKPSDAADALRMLRLLSGKTHRVVTGVVIARGGQEVAFSETTEVSFHPLDEAGIRYYVAKYKPFDKAGAYAIQEWIGVTGIRAIHGDFYNVMGLPVSRVVRELTRFGRFAPVNG